MASTLRFFGNRPGFLGAGVAAAAWLAIATPVSAQTITLNRDYDLVRDNGLRLVSQTDGRWAYFPVRNDPSINLGQCGCLLASFATVIGQQGGMLPWFPTRFDYFGGYDGAFDFNPRYLDLFLTYGPFAGGPPGTVSYPTGWGYKSRPPGTCGVIPLLQALQTVGTDGLGSAVGLTPVVVEGFGPDAKDIVNRNLIAGRPTIIAVRRGDEATVANHAMLIAGWDDDQQAYKVLDPMWPSAGLYGPTRPRVQYDWDAGEDHATTDPTYEKFEMRIDGVFDVRLGGFAGSTPSFLFGDDPSPIEILMTGPDGRRTGRLPATGTSFAENANASYWRFGPWLDPLGEVADDVAPRFITFPDAPEGLYHFTVTGVANGPLQLSAETLRGGTRVVLGEFSGTIAAGEVRKYELQFARTGASSVRQVAQFTPHANAGQDLSTRSATALTFDGRASFDVEGPLATYEWDFGDGQAGTGAAPVHVYSAPGDYTVTLTVTDADGATATDSLLVHVILAQLRPTAHPNGPYIGFASAARDRNVIFQGYRSSDPNGDPLTYRWDFGDGTPVVTTTQSYAPHAYATEGVYTATLVVNDGTEDSLPVSTVVEVVHAPSSWPFGEIGADLSPQCALPGQRVTLTLGDFAQWDWWDAGLSGPWQPLPPSSLPVGYTFPSGLHRLRIAGLWSEMVPFSVQMLGPGRYTATVPFTVPDLPPGTYQLEWGEDWYSELRIGCPALENHPPVADAGGPYAGAVSAVITFDGSASSDPDGDELEYEWHFGDGEIGEGVSPTHAYAAPGRYLVTLFVDDGWTRSQSMAGSRSFQAVVVTGAPSGDVTPPVTTAVVTPVANGAGWHTTDVAVALTAVDEPGGSGVRDIHTAMTGAQSATATAPGAATILAVTAEGTTDVSFHATDNAGNQESPRVTTVRIDRSGPVIGGLPAGQCVLWPPNHKFVTVANVTASDALSGLAPGGLLVSVVSSEVADGRGDGGTEPDVIVTGGVVQVRAERSGEGAGRTYTILAVATDLAGNTTRAQVSCVVPHDKGDKAGAVAKKKPGPGHGGKAERADRPDKANKADKAVKADKADKAGGHTGKR